MIVSHLKKHLLLAGSVFLLSGLGQADGPQQRDGTQSDPPRRTYFLGEEQQGPRLAGPSVGEPLSIKPQPYLEPGSLKIEEPDEPIDEMGPDDQQAGPEGEQEPVEKPVEAESSDSAGADNETEPNDLTPSNTNTGATGEAFEEAALASFDPSLQAVDLPEGSRNAPLTAFLWDGMSRAQAIEALEQLGGRTGSLSLRAFARSIAAGNFALPPSEDPTEVAALLRSRLNTLAAIGSPSHYVALIDGLPRGNDWSLLRRERTHAYLLAGRIADACNEASSARSQDQNPYWVRVAVLCAALRGDRAQVDFQLDILATLGSPSDVFYSFIDHLTLVAESEAQNVAPPVPQPISGPLSVDVLSVAMARLSRMPITSVSTQEMDPLAIEPALGLTTLDANARATLLRAAMSEGLVSLELMRAFVEGIEAAAQNVGSTVTENSAFGVDGVDIAALARLLITVRGDGPEAERLIALESLWGGAVAAGLELQLAPLIAETLEGLTPQPLDRAQAAIMTRVMLVAGKSELAQSWFSALRSAPAGRDLARDAGLTELAPMMAGAGVLNVARLPVDAGKWWDVSSFPTGDPQAGISRRAGLLLMLLESKGIAVPESHWAALESRAIQVIGPVPQPATWRRFLRAAHYGERSRLLSSLYKMVSGFGLKQMPVVLAGSIDGTLREQGMAPLANLLAFELMVASGL